MEDRQKVVEVVQFILIEALTLFPSRSRNASCSACPGESDTTRSP